MQRLADISVFESLQNSCRISNLRPERYDELTIRRIKPSETEKVFDLTSRCFPEFVRRDVTRQDRQFFADLFNNIAVGAFAGDKLVGYADIDVSPDSIRDISERRSVPNKETASWLSACVDKDYRGRGLQRALYDYAEKLLRKDIRFVETFVKPDLAGQMLGVLVL